MHGQDRDRRRPAPLNARLGFARNEPNRQNGVRMAAVVPDPKNIRAFDGEATFEVWLAANHDKKRELFLRIYKKDSGKKTVTHAQAGSGDLRRFGGSGLQIHLISDN